MVDKLIRRMLHLKTSLVLLFPRWPRRQWYHQLRQYLVSPPVKIRPHRGMFLRGYSPDPLQHQPPWPCFVAHLSHPDRLPNLQFPPNLSLDEFSLNLDLTRYQLPNDSRLRASQILPLLTRVDPNRTVPVRQLLEYLQKSLPQLSVK